MIFADAKCTNIAMATFLLENYLWLKAIHLIAVISWMVGLLYLPRLFAYHADVSEGSDSAKTFVIMERRLLKIIMNPAMILTWSLGMLLIWANPSVFEQGWMHVKFMCVIFLSILHMVFSKWRKVFERGENKRTPKFYKIWNEVPTLLMVIIIIMVIVKPF